MKPNYLLKPATQSDPFEKPMIFLRITWMTRYQGLSGDAVVNGGRFIRDNGFGHEIFNFQPFQGTMYGYVQPPGRRERFSDARIDLRRFRANATDNSVPGLLAVWVATSPTGDGAFIVGWYENATVFRDWQNPPAGSARTHDGTDCGYYVTAKSEDVVRVPPDERVFHVPQQQKGGFGQSNIWYADDTEQHRQFREEVLRYVTSRQLPNLGASAPPHQPDPLRRQEVERIAVETTTTHFTRHGYTVDSVEQDNIGWDLNAVLGRRQLQLEVKGLSGDQIVVELTPNEYQAMKDYRDSYRICVVTNALTRPHLEIFAYSKDSRGWESTDGRVLKLQEIIAARCTAT